MGTRNLAGRQGGVSVDVPCAKRMPTIKEGKGICFVQGRKDEQLDEEALGEAPPPVHKG
jgi:hypothetical protein